MQTELCLPPDAGWLLQTLRAAGYSAYVVGGCVRDSLLGVQPGDWDLCTSATPPQLRALFAGRRLILTGEKHGTVAVVLHGTPYEITTYRLDGAYGDSRHPDAVRFVPQVRQDLARRDFTVNAMAYAPGEGLVDAFGGQADLRARMVRCVGDPYARFGEDALRILRAVRFAAQLDFALDPATAAAAQALRDSVQQVSAERVFTELDKLLAGPAAGRVLAQHGQIVAGALPEILPCIGCTQPAYWHCHDVWGHICAAVGALDTAGWDERSARVLRWTVLLHDLAKPQCRTVDEEGVIHFPGHNQQGAKLARAILTRLKAPAYLADGACGLVAVHDAPLPQGDPAILRALGRYGPVFLRRLCAVMRADLDAHAQTPAVERRRAGVLAFGRRMDELAATGCYTVGMLGINGGDVMAQGVRPGPAVGRILHTLLDRVMDGALPNDRAALLQAAAEMGREA